jgi:hypothetical protein
VVGPGFVWLTGGTAGLIALGGILAAGSWWGGAGLALLVVGLIWARNRSFAGVMISMAGFAFLVATMLSVGWLPGLTAAVALGGVTGEMMLGHWYLIDPRLPRSILRALALAGIAGLMGDGLMLSLLGHMPGGGAEAAFWILLGTSVVLMVGVIGSLRYPAYSGVMAATGLSYLAVLTTLGSVFLGRALVAGIGPFAT